MKEKFSDRVDQMTVQIIAHLDQLISNDEECIYHIDVTNENLTEFFTALNNAICYKLKKIGMADTLLDAQHVYNKLLFQYLRDTFEDKQKS